MEDSKERLSQACSEFKAQLHPYIDKAFLPLYAEVVYDIITTSFKAGACFGAEDMKQTIIKYERETATDDTRDLQ